MVDTVKMTVGIDTAWALQEINSFMSVYRQGNRLDTAASAQVVEEIFDRVLPGWRESAPHNPRNRFYGHAETAGRAKVVLTRRAEIYEKLGDNAPSINASQFHPWVWEAAKGLWRNGHYRSAISAAALRVNAETQAKIGRMTVSETKLFQEVFSVQEPKSGCPRLRLWKNDGSDTYRSINRGAMAFAEGLFAAIRNPNSHSVQDELDERVALEHLAAFSVLARWVSEAKLEVVT